MSSEIQFDSIGSPSMKHTGATKWGAFPPSGALRLMKTFILLLIALVFSQLIVQAITSGSLMPLEQSITIHGNRHGSAQRLEQDPQILVTVVVPCYEQLDTLQRTLDSVTDQPGFPYYEIIVVNDGSPNGAEFDEFAKQYVEQKPAGVDHVHILGERETPVKPAVPKKRTVYFVTKQNGGLSSARNFAIDMASGLWIMPLDSDDMLANIYFESVLRELMRHDLNLWEPGPYNVISPGVATLDGIMYPEQPVGIEAVDLRKSNGITYSSMYLRSFATKHDVRYRTVLAWGWEDWDYWTRAHDKVGLKVLYVREPVFLYSSLGRFEKKEHMASFCEARSAFCNSIFVVANARLYNDKTLGRALDVLLSRKDRNNTIAAGRAKKAQWNHLLGEALKSSPDPVALFLMALGTLSEDRHAALVTISQVMAMQCDANGVDRLAYKVMKRVFTAPEITGVFGPKTPKPASKCENVLFSRILLGDRMFSASRGWFPGSDSE